MATIDIGRNATQRFTIDFSFLQPIFDAAQQGLLDILANNPGWAGTGSVWIEFLTLQKLGFILSDINNLGNNTAHDSLDDFLDALAATPGTGYSVSRSGNTIIFEADAGVPIGPMEQLSGMQYGEYVDYLQCLYSYWDGSSDASEVVRIPNTTVNSNISLISGTLALNQEIKDAIRNLIEWPTDIAGVVANRDAFNTDVSIHREVEDLGDDDPRHLASNIELVIPTDDDISFDYASPYYDHWWLDPLYNTQNIDWASLEAFYTTLGFSNLQDAIDSIYSHVTRQTAAHTLEQVAFSEAGLLTINAISGFADVDTLLSSFIRMYDGIQTYKPEFTKHKNAIDYFHTADTIQDSTLDSNPAIRASYKLELVENEYTVYTNDPLVVTITQVVGNKPDANPLNDVPASIEFDLSNLAAIMDNPVLFGNVTLSGFNILSTTGVDLSVLNDVLNTSYASMAALESAVAGVTIPSFSVTLAANILTVSRLQIDTVHNESLTQDFDLLAYWMSEPYDGIEFPPATAPAAGDISDGSLAQSLRALSWIAVLTEGRIPTPPYDISRDLLASAEESRVTTAASVNSALIAGFANLDAKLASFVHNPAADFIKGTPATTTPAQHQPWRLYEWYGRALGTKLTKMLVLNERLYVLAESPSYWFADFVVDIKETLPSPPYTYPTEEDPRAEALPGDIWDTVDEAVAVDHADATYRYSIPDENTDLATTDPRTTHTLGDSYLNRTVTPVIERRMLSRSVLNSSNDPVANYRITEFESHQVALPSLNAANSTQFESNFVSANASLTMNTIPLYDDVWGIAKDYVDGGYFDVKVTGLVFRTTVDPTALYHLNMALNDLLVVPPGDYSTPGSFRRYIISKIRAANELIPNYTITINENGWNHDYENGDVDPLVTRDPMTFSIVANDPTNTELISVDATYDVRRKIEVEGEQSWEEYTTTPPVYESEPGVLIEEGSSILCDFSALNNVFLAAHPVGEANAFWGVTLEGFKFVSNVGSPSALTQLNADLNNGIFFTLDDLKTTITEKDYGPDYLITFQDNTLLIKSQTLNSEEVLSQVVGVIPAIVKSTEVTFEPNNTIPIAKYIDPATSAETEVKLESLNPALAESVIGDAGAVRASLTFDLKQLFNRMIPVGEDKYWYPSSWLPSSINSSREAWEQPQLWFSDFEIHSTVDSNAFNEVFGYFFNQINENDSWDYFGYHNGGIAMNDGRFYREASLLNETAFPPLDNGPRAPKLDANGNIEYSIGRIDQVKWAIQNLADRTVNLGNKYTINVSDDYVMTIAAVKAVDGEVIYFGKTPWTEWPMKIQTTWTTYEELYLDGYANRSRYQPAFSYYEFNTIKEYKPIVQRQTGRTTSGAASLACDFSDLATAFDDMSAAGATELTISGFKVATTEGVDFSLLNSKVNRTYSSMAAYRDVMSEMGWRVTNANSMFNLGYSVTYGIASPDELKIIARAFTDNEEITQQFVVSDTVRNNEVYSTIQSNYDYVATGGVLTLNFPAGYYNFSTGLDLNRIALPGAGKIILRGERELESAESPLLAYNYSNILTTFSFSGSSGITYSSGPDACNIELNSIELHATGNGSTAVSVTNNSKLDFVCPMKLSGKWNKFGIFVDDRSTVDIFQSSKHVVNLTWPNVPEALSFVFEGPLLDNTESTNVGQAIAICCKGRSHLRAISQYNGNNTDKGLTTFELYENTAFVPLSVLHFIGAGSNLYHGWYQNIVIDERSSFYLYGPIAIGDGRRSLQASFSMAEKNFISNPLSSLAVRSVEIRGGSLFLNYNDFVHGQWNTHKYSTPGQLQYNQSTTRSTVGVDNLSTAITLTEASLEKGTWLSRYN